jgi:CRISPR system Cascade subunit CasB
MTPFAATQPSISELVQRIAALLAHGGGMLTTGDAATLRRMDPRHVDAPFLKLVGLVLDAQLPVDPAAREPLETRWAAIVVGLAHLGVLHRPGVHLGAALADAGFSELRLVRLLRADEERLIDDLPAVARFLSARGVAADWTDAARLLLSAGRSDDETVRRHLARDYYLRLGSRREAD